MSVQTVQLPMLTLSTTTVVNYSVFVFLFVFLFSIRIVFPVFGLHLKVILVSLSLSTVQHIS